MPEGVVDPFEPVDVDDEDGAAHRTAVRDGVVERAEQRRTVAETGERVAHRLVVQGVLGRAPFGRLFELDEDRAGPFAAVQWGEHCEQAAVTVLARQDDFEPAARCVADRNRL